MSRKHPFTEYRNSCTPPLSQAELAQLLGVYRSYVSRVESGERQVGYKKLAVFAKKTGLAPEALRPDMAKTFREAAE